MGFISKIYSKNENNIIGQIMNLVASILGSSYIQTIINIVFSIYTALFFTQNRSVTCEYITVTVIYFMILFIIIYLNRRTARKKEEAESLADVSTKLQKLVYRRMRTLDRAYLRFVENSNVEFESNIETEADFVCDAIYTSLSRRLDYDELEVVLWHQMPDDEGDGTVAFPVSFGTKGMKPPIWLNDRYYSNTDHPYRIVECFINNKELLFLTREECQNQLVFNTDEERKLDKTEQYIALPIRKRDGFTSAVIQLRAFRKNVFPISKQEVDSIINNWIAPFTNYYELSLEEQNIIEGVLANGK